MTSHCVWVYIILYLNYRNVSQTVHPHKQNVLYSKYHIIMISPLGMYLPWSCKFHSNCHRTCGYYIVWTGSEQSLPVMPAAPSPPCCKLWTAPLMKWRPMPWRSWLQLSGEGGEWNAFLCVRCFLFTCRSPALLCWFNSSQTLLIRFLIVR